MSKSTLSKIIINEVKILLNILLNNSESTGMNSRNEDRFQIFNYEMQKL